MNFKQRIVKLIYPWLKKSLQSESNVKVLLNKDKIAPLQQFHQLQATLNTGKPLSFDTFKGKKVLLVNTASSCGFTPQFSQLQALQDQFPDQLVVLGIPANDFKEQEQGNDREIEQFCQINYGVKFQITTKTVVVKGTTQHPVHQWLSNPALNGWNDQAPTWNFCKYLVDEKGVLLGFFASAVEPMDERLVGLVKG